MSVEELKRALPANCVGDASRLSGLGRSAAEEAMSGAALAGSPCPAELMMTQGNRLSRMLVNGPQIYAEFRERIAQARHAVDFAFFRWDDQSDCAEMIGDGLKSAAIATKKLGGPPLLVRLLVDDFMPPFVDGRPVNRLWDSVKRWQIDATTIRFELATYPHVGLGLLHDKFIVVDCHTLLLTGANPELKHDAPSPWRDTGFVLEGPVALAAAASFDDSWTHHSKHWHCRRRPPFQGHDCHDTSFADRGRPWLGAVTIDRGGPSQMIAVGRKAMVGTNPQNSAWVTLMRNARREIRVISPNIDAPAFRAEVIAAVARGVSVELLTSKLFNEPLVGVIGETNDEVVADLRNKVNLLPEAVRSRLKVRWHSETGNAPQLGDGPGALHAKFLTVDGQAAVIGSGNQDRQTWDFSREFNVLIDDADATVELDSVIFQRFWSQAVDAIPAVLPPPQEDIPIEIAWVELYDDKGFKDRRLTIRHPQNVGNMDNIKSDNGKKGFGDKASSARWFIPRGWRFVLYDDNEFRDSPFPLVGSGRVEENADFGSFSDKCSSGRWEQS
jgi:phosphatidylserine/phosphatidylglycerophosphate/cardiolipin synthase-like enzyme